MEFVSKSNPKCGFFFMQCITSLYQITQRIDVPIVLLYPPKPGFKEKWILSLWSWKTESHTYTVKWPDSLHRNTHSHEHLLCKNALHVLNESNKVSGEEEGLKLVLPSWRKKYELLFWTLAFPYLEVYETEMFYCPSAFQIWRLWKNEGLIWMRHFLKAILPKNSTAPNFEL